MEMTRQPSAKVLFYLFLFVLVFTKVCVAFTSLPDGAAVIWVANAALFSAFLNFDERYHWRLAGAAFAGMALASIPESSINTIFFGNFGNLVEAFVAYRLAVRLKMSPRLDTLEDAIKFVLCGPVVGALIGALIGAGVMMTVSEVTESYLSVFRTWWNADALGMLVFGPLLLTARQWREDKFPPLRPADWAVGAVTLIIAAVAFGMPRGEIFGATITPTLLLPPLMYVAARFGLRPAGLFVAAAAMAVAVAFTAGRQPFGDIPVVLTMLHAQEFILIASLLGMGSALLLAQIRAHQRELENRVAERTAQLTAQTEELRLARDEAETATRAKSSFLATMSHEIRTPMNGVTAMAEMLDQTDLSADQHNMVGVIRSSARALLTIINDILDFSKIEAGKMEMECIPFSPIDAVEEAAELVAGRAEEKALYLAVDIAPDIPAQVQGDPNRLRQILLNLIGNALKFTERGGVTVRLRLSPSDVPGTTLLRFSITDTGIGLTDEQRLKLFRPFQQADDSTARRFGGTGLGLTISRKLCEMMGGAIDLESVYGEGSTFRFEIPFQTAPEALSAPLTPTVAVDDVRVIAVGFDGEMRTALESALLPAGVRTTWGMFDDDYAALVPTGPSDDHPPPIVLLCGAGGGEAALEWGRRLLTLSPSPPPQVILAAPRSLVSTLGEAGRIGLFCTLSLPLRRRRLWRALAAACGRGELETREGRAGGDDVGWEPPSHDDALAAGALILVAEDNPINQTVIRRMLGQRGYAVDIADNGVAALAMWRPGRYGLLLTDFHMPEMDGFALTREIRRREQETGARIPIVALTADAMPGTEKRCLEAGMDAYLTKPVESQALAAALDRYLPQAKALRRPARAKPDKPTAATAPAWADAGIDPAIFDVKQLAGNFTPGDPDAVVFIKEFLRLAPELSKAAATAAAAGDLAAARDAAHTLKGAASSIGAVRLGRLAGDCQDVLDAGDADMAGMLIGMLEPTCDELAAAVSKLTAG
jgi:two-component system, sensor histidine kinase and response regulator